jgi:hypothetical protein
VSEDRYTNSYSLILCKKTGVENSDKNIVNTLNVGYENLNCSRLKILCIVVHTSYLFRVIFGLIFFFRLWNDVKLWFSGI